MTKADKKSQRIADDMAKKQKRKCKVMHTSRCTVCKHKDVKVIEARYINGESGTELAAIYAGISESAMYRHFLAFNFKAKRSPDKFLDDLIESAQENGVCLDERSLISAIKLWLQKEGKLVEKHETEIRVNLSDEAQALANNLIAAVGGIPIADGDTSKSV